MSKMTVKEFLGKGYLFEKGDMRTNLSGSSYTINGCLELENKAVAGDNRRHVIKARCLMLPKHFRLYKDTDTIDGLLFVLVNKDTQRGLWIRRSNLSAAVDFLSGSDTAMSAQRLRVDRSLKPIISFSQLGE